MPVVGVIAGLVCQASVIYNPEHESRLVAATSYFTLVRHDGWVDGSFQPLAGVIGRQGVDAGFQTSNDESLVVYQRHLVIGPACGLQLEEPTQAHHLLRLADLCKLVSIPKQGDTTPSPDVVL
jgi:hypothetical protein